MLEGHNKKNCKQDCLDSDCDDDDGNCKDDCKDVSTVGIEKATPFW